MDKEKKPFMIFTARPVEPTEIRGFFEASSDSVVSLLEEPGELRYAGWGLRTLDSAHPRKGKYYELRNGDRKVLRLYRDGTFQARVAADESFLGHASNNPIGNHIRINPVAITEFTYSFVEFYKRLLEKMAEMPGTIMFRLDIFNGHFNDDKGKLYLIPYGRGSNSFMFDGERYFVDEDRMTVDITFGVNDVVDAGFAAHKFLSVIYSCFGAKSDLIPFAEKKDGKVQIDPSRIQFLK